MLRPKRDLTAVVLIAVDAAERAGKPQLVKAIEAALRELTVVTGEYDSQWPRVH